MLSVLIEGFENRFQDCQQKKKKKFVLIFATGNFQMEHMEVQSEIQLKNLTVSLYFCKTSLNREKPFSLHNHALLIRNL